MFPFLNNDIHWCVSVHFHSCSFDSLAAFTCSTCFSRTHNTNLLRIQQMARFPITSIFDHSQSRTTHHNSPQSPSNRTPSPRDRQRHSRLLLIFHVDLMRARHPSTFDVNGNKHYRWRSGNRISHHIISEGGTSEGARLLLGRGGGGRGWWIEMHPLKN